MSHPQNNIPLGAVLQQAGLVSAEQVNLALQQQQQSDRSLRIGEILAIQGGIDAKTADFFAERWSSLVAERSKQPIGQYLKQAALLNEGQIQEILAEQQSSKSKFGELAIAKGWLKQSTVDFFLRYLKPEADLASKIEPVRQAIVVTKDRFSPLKPTKVIHSALEKDRDYSQKVHRGFLEIKRKLLKLEGLENYSESTLDRVLFWTNGHSLLTKKLFSLIESDATPSSPLQEREQIDRLVQTKIIDNCSDKELELHLKVIRDRLISDRQHNSQELLLSYQKVLTETVLIENNKDQQALRNIGLVVKQQNKLAVANRIYRSVFNSDWVAQELARETQLPASRQPKNLQSTALVDRPVKTSEPKESWFGVKNFLLLLTLIGLLTLFVNNIIKRIAVRKAFRQGNEQLQQKSFAAAIDSYNKLLKIDSNYFQAWTNRGYALAGLQKYNEMRESCSAATIIDPTAVYAWNCQGEALHNLNRDTEAIVAFDKAISLNQSDPIFLINKSESLRVLGDNEASIDSIQQAIAVLEKIEAIQGKQKIGGEFAVALTLLGNGYRQQSSFERAIANYDRANSYAPKYFPARVGRGITLNRVQRYSEAESEFETILRDSQLTEVQQAQTWFYLGKTLCQSAQNARGVEAFAKAIELNPQYEIAKEAQQRCKS